MTAKNPTALLSTLAVTASLAALALPSQAEAAIGTYLSAGATCQGGTTATFVPGTPVQVSLCVSTTTEKLCGSSYKFVPGTAAAAGRFEIAGRHMAPAYNFANAQPLDFPVGVSLPAATADLGAGTADGRPAAAGANQLLATVDVMPLATATEGSYALQLDGGFSIIAVDDGKGDCSTAQAAPFAGTITLARAAGGAPSTGATPVFASANAARFRINAAGTFKVAANGTPSPTLTLSSGKLPAGVTFSGGTLSGTPALGTAGHHVLAFTATSSGGTATQSFTLAVDKAEQTLAFDLPASQALDGAALTLKATASSGLPVTFASATPATCAVAGTSLTKRAEGVCTVTATQAGDANHATVSLGKSLTIGRPAEGNESLSINATPASAVAGQAVKLTALVSAANAGGTVSFNENGAPLPNCGAVAVSLLPGSSDAGVASCTVAGIGAGRHAFEARRITATGTARQALVEVTAAASGPADYTDMWWAGAAENGWGVSITQHGEKQFVVIYAYDAGRPTFYVLPAGTWNGNAFTGALYQPTSSPFSGYDAARFKAGSSVGSATLTYSGPSVAELRFTINGVAGVKTLQRQVFANDEGQPTLRVNDLWWAGSREDGWGINIAQQGRMLFPVWYTYDAQGRATFYAVPGGTWTGKAFTGDVYTTRGPTWLGGNYDPTRLTVEKVGTMTLDFADQANATMRYTVGGVSQEKQITRQAY